MFTLSPTLPFTLRFIFSSKFIIVVLRFLIGSDGLSISFIVAPSFSSAVPCVFILTPPGPKIFSAGPRSKCMSEKENFSFPFSFTISSFLLRKKAFISCLSLHFLYSAGVIISGVER